MLEDKWTAKEYGNPFQGQPAVDPRQLERRESQRLFHAGLPMPFLRLFHATRFTGGHDWMYWCTRETVLFCPPELSAGVVIEIGWHQLP